MRENIYVRVYGIVRLFGGKRNVIVFKMVLVMDMNDIEYYNVIVFFKVIRIRVRVGFYYLEDLEYYREFREIERLKFILCCCY